MPSQATRPMANPATTSPPQYQAHLHIIYQFSLSDVLKGLGHQMYVFLNAYKVKSVLSVQAQMDFRELACLVLPF